VTPSSGSQPVEATDRQRTVRLGYLWRFSGILPGCLLGLALAVVLGESGAVDHLGAGLSLLIVFAVVPVVALPAPRGFWLRADEDGLTLARPLRRRHYRWPDITRLDMEFGEEVETGAPRLTMSLRLTTTHSDRRGPVVGTLDLAAGHELRGTEPRELAELFLVLAAHGVPLTEPGFADRLLAVHRLPPLATLNSDMGK
jgi:hypothetical protein